MVSTINLDIPSLLSELKSTERKVRVIAAEKMARSGSKRVIQPLISLLSDRDWLIRKIAADGLVKIGAPCYEDICSLVNANHPDTRYWSIQILERLGEIAVNDLINTLKSPHEESRRFAAKSLGNMMFPAAITPLTEALADKAYRVRTEAANSLVKFRGQALPGLEAGLRSHNSDIRYWTIRCTGKILGYQAATEILLPLLSDPAPDKRTIGIIAFGEKKDPAAIPPLIERLSDPCIHIRREASQTLQRYSAVAIGPLKQALRHPVEDIKQMAAETLGIIVRKLGRNVIGSLSKLARQADIDLQAVSITALGHTHSEDAIQLISPHLGSPHPGIRRIASDSLIALGYRAIPHLMQLLNNSNEIMAFQAARTLGKLLDLVDSRAIEIFSDMLTDSPSKEMTVVALGETGNVIAIPYLMSLLTDDSWTIRRAATTALAGFGEKAVKKLAGGLKSPSDELRYWCTVALAEMCPRVGGGAMKALVSVLNSSDKDSKLIAINGLEGLNEQEAIHSLIEHLGDEFWPVRKACSNALVSLGEKAEEALRPAMLSSDDKDVRFWARKSIESIKDEKKSLQP